MKPISFEGDSLAVVRGFPDGARREVGFQLDRVQHGLEPADWKPLPAVGRGVQEIRVSDAAGVFRVVYVAKFADAIYVLHAFQKKTQATPKRELDLASRRYSEVLRRLK